MEADRATHTNDGDANARGRTAALRAIAVMGLSVLLIDLWLPSSLVLGSLLILPVFASAWLSSPRFTNVVTTACAFAAIFGAVVGVGGGAQSPPDTVALQLACSLFVIFVSGQLALLRIKNETRIDRAREVVATALRSIADAVVTLDRDDRVATINGPAARLVGVDAAAAVGRPVGEVVRLERDPETVAPPDPRAPRRQLLVLTRDGAEVRLPVEATSSPIVGQRGEDFGRVLVLRDASDVVAFEERMRELAYRDGLTGLANRRSLEERLDLELKHARRARARLGVLFLDLDGFKKINDTYGHRAGDELLVAVAGRLSAALREVDTVARISGDEFCVLVPELSERDDVALVAQKIVDAVVRPVVLDGVAVPVATSVGAAVYPDDAGSAASLLSAADAAMYRAKGMGGASWAVHDADAGSWAPKERGRPAPERARTGSDGAGTNAMRTRGDDARAADTNGSDTSGAGAAGRPDAAAERRERQR